MPMKKETKMICGVRHTKVRCIRCDGMVWTQAYLCGVYGYTCDTCSEPKQLCAGRGEPHKLKVEVLA